MISQISLYNKILDIALPRYESISAFCKAAGISKSNIHSLQRNKNYPSIQSIIKICSCLNISLDELLEIKPESKDNLSCSELELFHAIRAVKLSDKQLLLICSIIKSFLD